MKLFASDLDGTLLGPNDSLHPGDVAAIAEARRQGVIFTIATGRLTNRTHPTATSLLLDSPLVCADGGVTACSSTRRVLARRSIASLDVEKALRTFSNTGLSSFVMTADAIHCCLQGGLHRDYVRVWSDDITAHEDIHSAEGWRSDPLSTVMLLGIGAKEEVETAFFELRQQYSTLEFLFFPFGPKHYVIRVIARGVSKGAALAELSESLGVKREDVAVIGDWYNDLPMFEWAGRSFAMPQAPQDVKNSASDVVPESAREKGPIAYALEKFLGG